MKILALETTDPVGTVAAMADCKLLLELDLNSQQRTAQSLAPGIKTILDRVGWQPAEVQLVACAIGPGSFTGLRLGLTMAKTFAYAVGAAILGINTLDAIAEGAPPSVTALTAVVDAQRGDIVTRSYIRDSAGFLVSTGDQRLLSIDKWLEELPAGMSVAGPVLPKIVARLPERVTALDKEYWTPRAGIVARLAQRQYAAGRRDNLWTLLPQYSRQSAAEEKFNIS